MILTSTVTVLLLLVEVTMCEYGKISREKCKEYAKAIYVSEESPALMARTSQNTIEECALESAVPLIIGGITASEGEFPHMGIIGYGSSPDGELAWNCGCTLISDAYVLTAAHCSRSGEVNAAQRVRFGIVNLNISVDYNEDLFVEKHIVKQIVHPKYKRPFKYNDIALFKLESVVKLTPYIRPACLNTIVAMNESDAIATGFGKVDYDHTVGSTILMKVKLFLYSNTVCTSYFRRNIAMKKGLTSSMLCAGDLKGGKDTCQGDSGGPLQTILQEPYCMYNIIGVTSFGRFCGFKNSPAIYTNVYEYIPWIENIVWKNQSVSL